ncbi:MAG: precorrin-6y C5,15-methyltransferase (decarboxylating) subunit CbiE [Lachnospiraceae bacterium]|nr:precorrin-6y C5,15-methyltransferase (decarboxylating) subunit CbiE [Lachnospiraceae bacterium]
MPGIAVFGGTTEGRIIAEALCGMNLQLHICVATEYGASLLPQAENIHVYSGRMDEQEMEAFLLEWGIEYCVDATHPYAVEVTKNIAVSCERVKVPYIRILRKEGEISNGAGHGGDEQTAERRMKSEASKKSGQPQIVFAADVAEAAEYLCGTTGKIFITTGSKELEKYQVISDYRTRCVARVLPTLSVMEKCKELGFEGRNIIGMQGPFSEELNRCMLRQTDAQWLVTKNSGSAGGYIEKCEAALSLGVNILVVGRPVEVTKNGMDVKAAIEFLKSRGTNGKRSEALHRTIYLVAMGPGSDRLLTQEAAEVLEQADVLIGAKRILEIWPKYIAKPYFIGYKAEDIMCYLQEHPEYVNIALCYSGDIGFYSGAKGIRELLEEKNLIDSINADKGKTQTNWDVHVISGISSVVYFLNRIGVAWDEVELLSCHGQEIDLIPVLREKKKVCALLGKGSDVTAICRQLLDCKMDEIRMTVGECLSYPEERIVVGNPGQLLGQEFNKLSLILLEDCS